MFTRHVPDVRVPLPVRMAVTEQDGVVSNDRCGNDIVMLLGDLLRSHGQASRTTRRRKRPRFPSTATGPLSSALPGAAVETLGVDIRRLLAPDCAVGNRGAPTSRRTADWDRDDRCASDLGNMSPSKHRRRRAGTSRLLLFEEHGEQADRCYLVIIHDSPFDDLPLRNCSITERIFEGLEREPGAVVLIDGPTGRTVTAGQLMDDIRSVAGGLNAQGAGTGRTVALMAPNSPEYCTIFHAMAWTGGTVTTVNPAYTASEVRHQLDDAGADWLITVTEAEATARTATEGTNIGVIVLGDGTDPVADLRGAPIDFQVPVDLDNHVVVLPYSSGTTGIPKGVMLSHRNLVVNVDQILAVADIDPGEIAPAFLPFFHIYGLELLMNCYLAAGAGLTTLPRFDLELFLRLAQDHKAKRLWVVPPVAIALAKHPIIDQYDLSSIVQVNSAAAPWAPTSPRRLPPAWAAPQPKPTA